MIPTTCHSDDWVRGASFDATPWFENASDEDIRKLAECDYASDYPADAVAHFMADKIEDVQAMFKYLDLVAHIKDAPGFECAVSEPHALLWLKQNRPALHKELDKLEEVSDA